MRRALVPALLATALLAACGSSPHRGDRSRSDGMHRGDSPYRGDGGHRDTGGAPGGFGGPAPRLGESPTPRIPPGMVVRPLQRQSYDRIRRDRELCAQQAAIEPQSATERGYYERAVAICLEARGYEVR